MAASSFRACQSVIYLALFSDVITRNPNSRSLRRHHCTTLADGRIYRAILPNQPPLRLSSVFHSFNHPSLPPFNHATTMHRLLTIPEVLVLVINELDRHSVVQAVLTCRSWSDIALDALWRDLPSPAPLVGLLGPMGWFEGGDVSRGWVSTSR